MVSTDSLRFCFSGNVFIFKELGFYCDGYRRFDWQLFSLSILNILSYCLQSLDCMVSDEKPGVGIR